MSSRSRWILPVLLMAAFASGGATPALARDFIIRNATTSAVYFKVDGTSGNIGIGTSTPVTKLHVNASSGWGDMRISGVSGGTLQLQSGSQEIYSDGSYLRFQTGDNDRVTILSTGLVGITTTTPVYGLDVVNTARFSQPVIVGTPTTASHAATKSYVDSTVVSGSGWTDGGASVYLTTIGDRVGIGTSTPTAPLHVLTDVDVTANPDTKGIRLDESPRQWLLSLGVSGVSNQYFAIRDVTSSTYPFVITNSTGNVGIGTTGPGQKLDVVGNIQASGSFILNGGASDYVSLLFDTTSAGLTGRKFVINHGNSTAWTGVQTNYGTATDSGFFVRGSADSNYFLVVRGSGNVGIGTSTPQAKLHVDGAEIRLGGASSANYLTLWGNGTNSVFQFRNNVVAAGTMDAYYNGVTRMVITSAGLVGITTTTPVYGLDVVNTARFSQPVFVGTPTAATHAATKSYVDSTVGGGGAGAFTTLTSSATTTLATNANDRVGIGTASPGYKLDVAGTVQLRDGLGGNGFNWDPGGSGNAGTLDMYGHIAMWGGTISGINDYLKFQDHSSKNYGIDFLTYDSASYSSKLRIMNSGNVGIGTTTPAGIFTVATGLSGAGATVATLGNGAIAFTNGAGGSAFPTIIARSNDNLGLGIIAGTNNAQSSGDFAFDIRENDNTDYATTNVPGFSFRRFGSPLVTIRRDGLVGITTTTPVYGLDVVNTARFSQPVFVGTPTAATHAATKSYVDSVSAGSSGVWLLSGSNLYTSSTSWNVGVGTTTPQYLFHAYGSGNQYLALEAGSASSFVSKGSSGTWYFGSAVNGTAGFNLSNSGAANASEIFVSNSTGNVGISTSTPNHRLTVNGDILALGGDILFGDFGTSNREYISSFDSGITGLNTVGVFGFFADASLGAAATSPTAGISVNGIYSAGSIGISSSSPGYALTVSGTGYFSQPVIVGTPTQDGHAATKNYVDSIVGGGTGAGSFTTLTVSGTSTLNGNLSFGGPLVTNLNLNSKNIVGVNKLTVTTIDPLYEIAGKKYSTYAASIAGGVKEEFVGKGRLTPVSNDEFRISSKGVNDSNIRNSNNQSKLETQNSNLYQYVIDFDKVREGSDLWLWRKAVDFSDDNVQVFATPKGVPVAIAYEIEGNKIIFRASVPASIINNQSSIEFSYRLIGNRFDWKEWPTFAKDQSEKAGLIINQ